MDTLERLPFKARKAVFDRLEQMASIANLTPLQRDQYEAEWAAYNDYYNTMDFAEQKGRAEGRAEGLEKGLQKGRAEGLRDGLEKGRKEQQRLIAVNLKAQGIDLSVISAATGLSPEEIEAL